MNKKITLLIFFSYLIFFVLIPPLNTPDEPEHYENIYWVAQGIYPYNYQKGQSPKYFVNDLMSVFLNKNLDFDEINNSFLHKKTEYNLREKSRFSLITFQSYHPPLFYILLSPAMWLSDLFKLDLISRFYLTRLFSSFFYFGSIYFIYHILKLIIKNNWAVYSILIFFSLNPVVIKTSIGLNPDQGIAFFSTVGLFLVIKYNQRKMLKLKQIIYLAIISAAATLAKFSGIFTLLFSEIFLFLKLKKRKSFFIYSFYYLFISVFIIMPWFYLNLKRYGRVTTDAFIIGETRIPQPQTFLLAIVQAFYEFRHTIMHYSGFLGSTNEIYPSKIFFFSYTILISIFALIGLIKIIKKQKIIIYYFFSLLFFLYLLSFYFKRTGLFWDIQGRYFLSGFFPMSVFVFYGLLPCLNNIYLTGKAMILFAIIHYYYILFAVLIPGYYEFGNLSRQLKALHHGFADTFIVSLSFHLILSFLMIKILLGNKRIYSN